MAKRTAYAALTPYPIPVSLMGRKVVNLGDGLILQAIERLIGRFDANKLLSPRVALSSLEQAMLEESAAVILAGANQLNDRYTVWPGLTADRIRETGLRLIPFGIGLHGEEGYTDQLSPATRDILLALHERIEYSSWRCPRTIEYLKKELPQLEPQLLMTGCPVLYDHPLLSGQLFGKEANNVAVTVTERGDFWARETAVIDFVAREFKRTQRYLVLHQNYSPPGRFEHLANRWLPKSMLHLDNYQLLRRYAIRRGFKVICPPDAAACAAFYNQIDLHIGSRLHAHLYCLSRAKRSWLIPVDGRATGVAEYLGFPLCQPDNLGDYMDFDFEVVRNHAYKSYATMQTFLHSLPA